MKKYQSGFGVVGVLVAVVIVGLIVSAGWLFYRQQDAANKETAQQTKQAQTMVYGQDSTKSFSYSYPSNWSLQKYVWQDCCDGPQKTEPDWSKQPQPITLKEKSSPLDAAIRIDEFGPNAIDREYSSRTEDQFNTYTKLKVNSYDALHHVTDFVGPSAAEKYKDHEYIISSPDGKKSVRLQFRESYSNSTIQGENDFNASALLPDFEKIVRSVTFLNPETSN